MSAARQKGRLVVARLTTLAGLVVILHTPSFPQSGKIPSDQKKQIQTAVAKFMAERRAPGVAVAVVENGEYAWSSGFGMADLENSVPVTPQTLFRLGSISKPLTSVAAMQLWEQGKLDLDAPVQKYCPAFPQKEAPITTRQLLGHLAGIRHYRSDADDDAEIGNTRHYNDPIAGGLNLFKEDPLVSRPGAHYNYTTHGYTVIGCAIEGASGERYVDYLTKHLYVPAGMAQTQADDRYSIVLHRTRFYHRRKSGEIVNADFLDSSYKIPGGGWLSSADDLAKFSLALMNDSLVKRSTRDLMWTALRPADGSESTYGLGWGILHTLSVPAVEHRGGQQGTSTALVIAASRRSAVVVLTNMDDVDAGDLAESVMRIVLKSSAAR